MYSSVSFSPWGLVILPGLFWLLMKWPKQHGKIDETSRVGIFRRVAAFCIDVMVGMIGILPFVCMIALTTEYFATGDWQWSYARDYFRPTDLIGLSTMLLGFCGIFVYFKWHFDRERQTVGQHLLHFKLIASGERPSMGLRFVVAWANGAWWPIWPWTILKNKQDYWWDSASRIKARRVAKI